MLRIPRSWPLRFGIAVLATATALLLSLVLQPLITADPFLLFFAAVAFSASFGLGPGLLATLLSVAAVNYFFLGPPYALAFDPVDLFRGSLFVLVAILISSLQNRRIRAEVSAASQRERLRITLSSIGDAVIATDANRRVDFMNRVAESLTGWQQSEALGKDVQEVFHIVNEQTRQPVQNPVSRVIQEGAVIGLANDTLLISRDGVERPIDDSGAPIRDETGKLLGTVLTFRDIAERKHAERVERFLNNATVTLATSLDYETTLATVARLAVPTIADWCTVHIVEPDGSVQRLALAHADPAKIAWANDLQRRYPPDPEAKQGVFHVIHTAEPEFYPEITDEMLVATARDSEQLQLMRDIGFTSAMIAPLVARGRVLGAIQFVTTESRNRYTDADFALAQNLARRAAVAVDNARLYRQAREQGERLQVTLSSIGDAVIATDAQGHVTFINTVAQNLTGWSQSEAVGKPLADVFQIVNEATRAAVENPVTKVMRLGAIIGLANHTVLIARNGQEIPIDDSGAPIRDEVGNIIGVILVFRDITERKRAEDVDRFLDNASATLASSLNYETTLQNVARLVVSLLADYCLIDVVENDGAFRRIAVAASDPRQEELLRELQRRYPLDRNREPEVVRVLRTGTPLLVAETSDDMRMAHAQDDEHLRLMREIGTRSAIVVPLTVHDQVLGAISFGATQPERRYGPEDLLLAQELAHRAALALDNARLYHTAQQAIQARDEFLSVAAHELRTPVTSLRGFSQLLMRQIDRGAALDPARLRRALQTIDEQSTKLTRLVAQLLDVSRIQAGRLSLDLQEIDLAALVENAVAAAQANTTRHVITLHGMSPLRLLADPIRLGQVLTNLLDNAIKYSPTGGPVEVEASQPTGDMVRLSVTDRGIGIAPEHRPHIFDRFYRAHAGSNFGGMGLGLYISRQIVELHQGRIEVESPAEGGTRFVVSLPIRPSVSAAQPSPGAPTS
jgi:PAS domain S-box-containing protein